MNRQSLVALQLRIGAALYYGFVVAIAIHRLVVMFSGRLERHESYFDLAIFAGLALTGWWLLGTLHWMSDRIAALLYGVYYAVKVGAHFALGKTAFLLTGLETAVISAGMVAIIVGLVHATSDEPQHTD